MRVVSKEEWLEARRSLLDEEKALQRARDELAKKRRELPWRRVEQDYEFVGENGAETLADLFGDCSQLIIYQFPDARPCREGS